MTPTIIAAGAVVWRHDEAGKVEVLLIHRPRYDDWSLPKGKVERGEDLISCAYREVIEETGFSIQFGPFVGKIEYFVPDGLKCVNYWSARVLDSNREFAPNAEVDAIKWCAIEAAISQATRDSDREIIEKFIFVPFDTYPLIMLRHGKALAREEWRGEDEDRPLEQLGQLQSKRMLSMYQVYGLSQIITSDAVRCYDTVSQMAKSLKIELKVSNAVSEYTFKKSKVKSIDFVKNLIKINESTLLCSHNPVLPKMMAALTKKINFEYPDNKLLPAQSWILHHDKKVVLAIDRLAAPTT